MEEKLTQAEEVLAKTFDYLERILNDNRESEESAGKGRYDAAEKHRKADEKSAKSFQQKNILRNTEGDEHALSTIDSLAD